MSNPVKYDITTEHLCHPEGAGQQTYGIMLSECVLGNWSSVIEFPGISRDRELIEHLQKSFNREQLSFEEFVGAMGEFMRQTWREAQ